MADCLKAFGVDQRLVDEAVTMRNFFARGPILGDYAGRGRNTYRKFELSVVIRLFKDLVLALENVNARARHRLMGDVAERLSEQLADMKYKDYAQK